MNKQTLINAIRRSSGKRWALDEADALWLRLDFLHQTRRYGQMLSNLANANNKNNFLAHVLEANFAYQFESRGLELIYEVQQDAQKRSSIDFLRKIPQGASVYFELHLLQQRKSIRDSIHAQLEKWSVYGLAMGGDDEQQEVVRIQNAVLDKVQDKSGRPIKFFSTDADAVNIVVVDVTASVLGAIDVHDCILATLGDSYVQEVYRRRVFGLFQVDLPGYPQHICKLAERFSHIRSTLHGVLFLFKKRNTGILAYRLEQYIIWNPALMNEAKARHILADIACAIPIRQDQ